MEGLRYEPDPEQVETAEADAPRSWLVPGVTGFKKKGTGDNNDEADGDNDDK